MHEELRTISEEQKFYVCDVCQKGFTYMYLAKDCENKHKQEKCSHDNVKYFKEDDNFITKACVDCEHREERSLLYADDDKLPLIWELLE
jgi:hypothetical protein